MKDGRRFTITRRGEAIADLVPAKSTSPKDKAAAVEKFYRFMRENPLRATVNVKALIGDGRA